MELEPTLTAPYDLEFAHYVQDNLYALFRTMAAALPGGEVAEAPGLSMHHAFPSNPMFKGAWATRLAPEDTDEAIDNAIAWFEQRKAPYFFWWTGPRTTPGDLGERLMRRGFLDMAEQQKELAAGIHQTSQGAPGMVADLHKVDESLMEKTPPGFEIREITTERELHDFKRVFVLTYEIPDWAGQAWVDATLAVGIDRSPWRIYVGYLDGRAVATNMLFNGGGVAGVYAVATVPEAQRKGIGAAITLQPLLDARDQGMRLAALFSTGMGQPVYERIGFRTTGARVNRFLWRSG